MIKNYKTLLNIFGAAFHQAGNYAISLCLLLILTNALGVAGYGEFAYVTAIIQYFIIFVDWGFSLSSTKDISISRFDKERSSEIFWTTVTSRALLCVAGYLLLEIGCWIFGASPALYRWGYLAVVGTVLSPLFFYTGIERLLQFSTVTTIVKFISVPIVWMSVTDKQDIALAVAIPAFFTAVSYLVSFVCLLKTEAVGLPNLKKINVRSGIMDGWHFFLSTASVSLFTNSNVTILGIVAGPKAVGYFSSALLMVRAVQGIYQPASQVFFSKISHAFEHDLQGGMEVFRKILIWQGSSVLVISALMFAFGPDVLVLMLGKDFDAAQPLVRWLSFLVFFVGLSNVFGIQGMLPLGYNAQFTRILLGSGLINMLSVAPMAYMWGALGVAVAVVITELCITMRMGLFLYRQQPVLFAWRVRKGG